VTYKASNPPGVVTLQSLSAFPPYSRKPGPYGPTMSVCAKVMSRGVHNIAFSLSPDDSWVFDLENGPQNRSFRCMQAIEVKMWDFRPSPALIKQVTKMIKAAERYFNGAPKLPLMPHLQHNVRVKLSIPAADSAKPMCGR
jgi:hypothetical protein